MALMVSRINHTKDAWREKNKLTVLFAAGIYLTHAKEIIADLLELVEKVKL
jgi:hypothetical protein